MGSDIEIRPARVTDAQVLADAWRAFGRYYADIDPDQFRDPDAEGLPVVQVEAGRGSR